MKDRDVWSSELRRGHAVFLITGGDSADREAVRAEVEGERNKPVMPKLIQGVKLSSVDLAELQQGFVEGLNSAEISLLEHMKSRKTATDQARHLADEFHLRATVIQLRGYLMELKRGNYIAVRDLAHLPPKMDNEDRCNATIQLRDGSGPANVAVYWKRSSEIESLATAELDLTIGWQEVAARDWNQRPRADRIRVYAEVRELMKERRRLRDHVPDSPDRYRRMKELRDKIRAIFPAGEIEVSGPDAWAKPRFRRK